MIKYPFILPSILIGTVATVAIAQMVALSLTPGEICEMAEKFVVKIDSSEEKGSGSIIGKSGETYQVLTNWHVVDSSNNPNSFTIQTFDKQTHKVSKIERLQGADLAIVTFESDKQYTVVKLGDAKSLKRPDVIYYAGHPLEQGRGYRCFDAKVSGFLSDAEREDLSEADQIQVSNGYDIIFEGTGLKGISGGPILDSNGKLIGVSGAASGGLGGASLYGIPINTVTRLAQAQRVNLIALSNSPQPSPTPTPQPSPTPTPKPSPSPTPKPSPSPERLLRTLQGHSVSVKSVAISRDGRTIVSGSDDNTVKVWELATGKLLRTLEGHSEDVYGVAISGDGRTIVSGSRYDTVQVWELATGKLLRTLEGHSDDVESVAISGDGRTIVSGSWDDTVKVWELATGKLLRTLEGHSSWVGSVAISGDSQTIVSGSRDDTVKVWELATGRLLRTLQGHSNNVKSVAISRDGKTIVSGSTDDTVKVWELATGKLLRTLQGHSGNVLSVAISGDGKTVVSGSVDTDIRVWKINR